MALLMALSDLFIFFFYIKHLHSNIKPTVTRHTCIYLYIWEEIIIYKRSKKKKKKCSNIHVVKNNRVENMNTNSPKW